LQVVVVEAEAQIQRAHQESLVVAAEVAAEAALTQVEMVALDFLVNLVALATTMPRLEVAMVLLVVNQAELVEQELLAEAVGQVSQQVAMAHILAVVVVQTLLHH
jgi:hypothetical protein